MVRENRKLHLQICNDPLRIHQGIQWVSTYASSQHAGVRFKNPYFSPINLKTAIIPSTKSTICASHIVMMFFSELVLFLSIAWSYFVNRIMKSAKNPCGSKCLWTSCFNKSIQHISASLRQLYCWLTDSVTFKCVEMFNLDTKGCPCTLAVADWRLLWPAQDKGLLMKKRSWKMWVITKIYFPCCASSTSLLAICPLLYIHHLHPSKEVQPKHCPLVHLPSTKDFLKSTVDLAVQTCLE